MPKKERVKRNHDIPEDVRDYITDLVEEGFLDEEQIVEEAAECAAEEHGRDDLRPEIEGFTAQRLAEHRRAQSNWQGLTDCDKLDAAFAALEKAGIVARQNFCWTVTCGLSEIQGEIEEARRYHEVTGFVFYTTQYTQIVYESGTLCLVFGSAVAGDLEGGAEVGRIIVRELERQGLRVKWDGKPYTYIVLTGLEWKRRR